MKKRHFRIRILSMVMALALLSSEASAVIKEVYVGGAYSINDLGYSDNRVSMEEVKQDYHDFKQTDWLTEYFHRDLNDLPKKDMDVALSWLVDHEVMTRDVGVTVTGIAPYNSTQNIVPSITIEKAEPNDIYAQYVRRSDLIMYLYRAVFGPIDSRTLGVETPNIRTNNTDKLTLFRWMMNEHYFDLVDADLSDGIYQYNYGASGGTGGSASGSSSARGGRGGNGHGQQQSITTTVDTNSTWRYTPQGDEYESIFGDTNIFVSDVDIAQNVQGGGSGGTGGAAGGAGGTGGSASGGGTGGTGGAGGAAASGGSGAGGGAQGAIQYETDYKNIYYMPGADLLFYRSNDVVEEYIWAAQSKGLLSLDNFYKSQKYVETFDDTVLRNTQSDPTDMPIWHNGAPARILNREFSIQNTTNKTVDTLLNLRDTLGVNYIVTFNAGSNNATMNVIRKNAFNSDTGYFTSEDLTKMDVLRHIYDFIVGSEKQLSNLEVDIVNYKYGLNLASYNNPEDTKVIKYLIAKGILNFDNPFEFMNLNQGIQYRDFIPILYRVANPDARLDFSKIQLTDSEKQWQAAGYAQNNIYITDGDPIGAVRASYTNLVLLDDEDSDVFAEASVYFGVEEEPVVEGTDPLSLVDTDNGVVELADWTDITTQVSGDPVAIGDLAVRGMTFDMMGLAVYGVGGSGVTPANLIETFIEGIAGEVVNNGDITLSSKGLMSIGTYRDSAGQFTYGENAESNLMAGVDKNADDNYFGSYWWIAGVNIKPSYAGFSMDDAVKSMSEAGGNTAAFTMLQYLENTITSIFFIDYCKKNPGAYSAAKNALNKTASQLSTDYFGGKYKNECNMLEGVLLNLSHRLESYVEGTYCAANKLGTVRYTFAEGMNEVSGANGTQQVWDLTSLGAGDTVKLMQSVAVGLYSIEFDLAGSAGTQYWVLEAPYLLTANPSTPNLGDINSLSTWANAGNSRKFKATLCLDSNFNTAYGKLDAAGQSSGTATVTPGATSATELEAATKEYTSSVSQASTTTAAATGNSISLTVSTRDSGENGYIDWDVIAANEPVFHIAKVSDFILKNTETNTLAYFSAPDMDTNYAIVGTDIVDGPDQDKIIKYEGGHTFYWFEAIRALAGMQTESASLNGMQGASVAAAPVRKALSKIPVVYESGYKSDSVYGLRLMLHRNGPVVKTDTMTPETLNLWNRSQKWTLPGSNPASESYWANFISLSTANRIVNVVSKKIEYTISNDTAGGTPQEAYLVLFFEPDDDPVLTTAPINKDMSMEQVLDAVSSPPEDAAALARYNENMKLSNGFANMIYGTTDVEYIQTGYLRPSLYIYAQNADVMDILSNGDFTGIPPSLRSLALSRTYFYKLSIYSQGAVSKPGTYTPGAFTGSQDLTLDTENYGCSYYLSEDYRVALLNGKIYINANIFTQLEQRQDSNTGKYQFYLKVQNAELQNAVFTLGRSFYLEGYTDDYLMFQEVEGSITKVPIRTPKLTIIEKKSDGTIVCQVGPIYGTPFKYNTQPVVCYPGISSSLTASEIAGEVSHDLLAYTKDVMFKGYLDKVKFEPSGNLTVSPEPTLTIPTGTAGSRSYVNVGNSIRLYSTNRDMYRDFSTLSVYSAGANSTVEDIVSATASTYHGDSSGTPTNFDTTETYFNVSFSCFDFTIKNDQLVKSNTTVGDLLNAASFTNLNDLIIDKMIDEDHGAIPVNEVPAGALLELGSALYVAATNDSVTKTFVGYSPIDCDLTYITSPSVQQAAYSFAGHFLRGGSQYINVTHFFKEFNVLHADSSVEVDSRLDSWKNSMQACVDYGMSDYGIKKVPRYCNTADGVSMQLIPTAWGKDWSNQDMNENAQFYAPVLIRLDDSLMAYKVSDLDGEVEKYRLVNHVNASQTGAMSGLPFFNDEVLSAKLADRTTSVIAGGYMPYIGAPDLMDQIRADFQKAFAGDLFTLARMLVFIVLIWLFLMSWVCYAFYASRLMPMVEALCHPTGDRQGKGVDLFKIFSLGTISVDTDFKLGRFLQYDFIIAILILIVWKSGNILF